MKISKEYGKLYINITENLFIETQFQWNQFISKKLRKYRWNWVSFNFIDIYFENDIMIGGLEFIFILLGIGFRIRYNYNDKLNQMVKDVTLAKLKKTKNVKK